MSSRGAAGGVVGGDEVGIVGEETVASCFRGVPVVLQDQEQISGALQLEEEHRCNNHNRLEIVCRHKRLYAV